MTSSPELIGKLDRLIADFGLAVKDKFDPQTVSGDPEEQLRHPLDQLITAIALILRPADGAQIRLIGETRKRELKLRLDFAVCHGADLIGYVEVKSPDKGADPRRFKPNSHDGQQWEKLKLIPNLLYCSGDEFSLWHYGEIDGEIIRLKGSVRDSGSKLRAPPELLVLFRDFFGWQPIPPENVDQLAVVTARLCRLLRDEFSEQLGNDKQTIMALHSEWREMLFPDASDSVFADSFAQAVTFGMLLARVDGFSLKGNFSTIANHLKKNHSLIGSALQFIAQDDGVTNLLSVSLRTLSQVLETVDWSLITKGRADSWLYFYEDFLQAYDPELRKQTGSYYTPQEIVETMVSLVDDTLRDAHRFNLPHGLGDSKVKIIDPAMGTGTYILTMMRHIAKRITEDEGAGSVKPKVKAALKRLIGFEIQFGPFVVAQARLLSEFSTILGEKLGEGDMRLYLDDTLEDPEAFIGELYGVRGVLAGSRKAANAIKLKEEIMVVIGNPPYKEKAMGKGGWIEKGNSEQGVQAPLNSWLAPKEWGVGNHSKHLRNLYVYFWRWASWKVFGGEPILKNAPNNLRQGMVCFVTMTGFINGPGFQKMRADLRRDADEIWVIHCSPEGMQPPIANAVFTQIINPVCIMLAVRLPKHNDQIPAKVYYRSLPKVRREDKFKIMLEIKLGDNGWERCDDDWRAPFLPKIKGAWAEFPSLDSLFDYNGCGVMPGRVWPIAPDPESLKQRWNRLIKEKDLSKKNELFHPHQRGDRTIDKILLKDLQGNDSTQIKIADETTSPIAIQEYAFRSFDRQYIIADKRLINRPNPKLWNDHSDQQIYLTSLERFHPEAGAAVTFCSNIPDLHHYKGSYGGRVFPLWGDASASKSNVSARLLSRLTSVYRRAVTAPEVMAYIAAVAAHPAYTEWFQEDLQLPGLRIPITGSEAIFAEAVELGKLVIWLHCYGERFAAPEAGRPPAPPRLAKNKSPRHSGEHPIPDLAGKFPDKIDYLAEKKWLLVGDGVIENVSPVVWGYEISGKQIVRQWFSYRQKDRTKPMMGDRRQPSELGKIQPDHWLAEYTTDLLNLLHVLGWLVELEPQQAGLLETICTGDLISTDEIALAKTDTIRTKITRNSYKGLLI